MPRIALDLNTAAGRAAIKAQWRVADGYIPGQPNQGLVAEVLMTPAREKDFDDSGWEVCDNVRAGRSVGLCFAWYRIVAEVPAEIDGQSVAGARILFETNVDNYAEVWVNGGFNRATGAMNGLDYSHRVEVAAEAKPGDRHTIAVLAVNGPLAEPRGGVFLRYAHLAFETRG